MREILFRGKRTKTGKWVEGLLFHHCEKSSSIWSAELDRAVWVAPETVGQFTGLTDKNGKRIFEGDILTIARKTDGMGTYYVPTLASPVKVVVKWDFCGWMWETLCEDKRYLHFPDAWCHFECEIVGNIHDNPELLEVLK
jgi:uncharacterized phage protein (TIGR01671 family)